MGTSAFRSQWKNPGRLRSGRWERPTPASLGEPAWPSPAPPSTVTRSPSSTRYVPVAGQGRPTGTYLVELGDRVTGEGGAGEGHAGSPKLAGVGLSQRPDLSRPGFFHWLRKALVPIEASHGTVDPVAEGVDYRVAGTSREASHVTRQLVVPVYRLINPEI